MWNVARECNDNANDFCISQRRGIPHAVEDSSACSDIETPCHLCPFVSSQSDLAARSTLSRSASSMLAAVWDHSDVHTGEVACHGDVVQ